MIKKPLTCEGCPLQTLGAGFSYPGGSGDRSRVLVVAEALGEAEVLKGEPLVGRAGKVWDQILGRTFDPQLARFLSHDDFLYDNTLRCQPPGNVLTKAPYEHAALESCRPNLEATIRDFKPRAILTLGNTALRWFTGQWGIESLRGYVFETPYGPVVPTYHPSYIMRGNWRLARIVTLDVLKALEVARLGTKHFFVEKAYELSPGYHEAKRFFSSWRLAGKPPLAFDIETPRADEAAEAEDMVFEDDASYTILMISFSYEPFKAISIPWMEPFISLAKEAFLEPADFLVWNAKFDVPRLMASGVHFGGRVIDAMIAWHWLEPSLPMGLKSVATYFCPDMAAWKLEMHKNFQWYNCADSDVLLRVYLEVQRRLAAQGRWKTFERHFLDFGKILMRMSERGVKVDHEARRVARDDFEGRFRTVVGRAGELAPPSLGNVSPKRGYVREPKDLTGLVQIQIELTEVEIAKRKKEVEVARQKALKESEKQARKNQREEAKRAKALGKEDAKRRKGKAK